MSELKRASARGVAWNLIQNLAGRLLGLIVVAILGRMLDRSAFGAVALALAITGFAELIVNQGYGEYITQRPALDDEHLDSAFWFNGALGLLLTLVIMIGADPIAQQFAEASVAPIVRWISLSLLLRSLSVVPTGLLVRTLRFRSLSLRNVVASAIGGVAGITAAALGMGIYSLVIQILVGDLAATTILWTATDWRPGTRFSIKCVRELSAFGAPIFGASMLGFVSRRLDAMFVVGALGLTTLGVYSMGQRVYQIASQILNKSSDEVAFSALARLSESADRRRQAFYRVIEVTAALCFPCYVGLAIVALPLIALIFGDRWADSAPVLSVFALAGVPITLSYLHVAAIKSAARTRFVFVIHVVLVSIYVPLMLVLVDGGAASAAAAYLISCCMVSPLEIMFVRAAIEIDLVQYLRALFGPTLAAVVMAAATLACAHASDTLPNPLRLPLEALSGLAAYLLGLRIFAPETIRRCKSLIADVVRARRQPNAEQVP